MRIALPVLLFLASGACAQGPYPLGVMEVTPHGFRQQVRVERITLPNTVMVMGMTVTHAGNDRYHPEVGWQTGYRRMTGSSNAYSVVAVYSAEFTGEYYWTGWYYRKTGSTWTVTLTDTITGWAWYVTTSDNQILWPDDRQQLTEMFAVVGEGIRWTSQTVVPEGGGQ